MSTTASQDTASSPAVASDAERPDAGQTVLVTDVGDGVRLITINRPSRLNALSHPTYLVLAEWIRASEADSEVTVTVITGAGGNFTSGNDIENLRRVPQIKPRGGRLLYGALVESTKPVVAAIEGYAVGIGAAMLLHCDLAFAGEGAQFRFPFATLGLTPEGSLSYLLPRLAGDKRAAELLMLAEMFGAEQAESIGLVNRVVPEGAALEVALNRARALSRFDQSSIRATKAALRRREVAETLATIDAEYRVFDEHLSGTYTQNALAEFANRRR
ncbi:enoyl-CoA hydratase/isomerase family protein [Gordonia sp. NPDC003424]